MMNKERRSESSERNISLVNKCIELQFLRVFKTLKVIEFIKSKHQFIFTRILYHRPRDIGEKTPFGPGPRKVRVAGRGRREARGP